MEGPNLKRFALPALLALSTVFAAGSKVGKEYLAISKDKVKARIEANQDRMTHAIQRYNENMKQGKFDQAEDDLIDIEVSYRVTLELMEASGQQLSIEDVGEAERAIEDAREGFLEAKK